MSRWCQVEMITTHNEVKDYLVFGSVSYAKHLDDTLDSVRFHHLLTHILPQSHYSKKKN